MDRQTLRDWVIRFNEQGPDGLINIPSPGPPPKLDDTHKAFLRRIVDEGPIPAVHGVVRWRASDLIMRLHGAGGSSGSRAWRRTPSYSALKGPWASSHVSAPGRRGPKQAERNAEAPKNISLLPLPPACAGWYKIWQFELNTIDLLGDGANRNKGPKIELLPASKRAKGGNAS